MLPVTRGQLWFISHPNIKEYPHMSRCVAGPEKNGVCCRKFGEITFESRHPIYIQYDGRHLIFVGVAWHFSVLKTSDRECLWFPTDWWKLHGKIPILSGNTEGCSFCTSSTSSSTFKWKPLNFRGCLTRWTYHPRFQCCRKLPEAKDSNLKYTVYNLADNVSWIFQWLPLCLRGRSTHFICGP